MSRRNDAIRLEDMLSAAKEAVGFAASRNEEELARDRQLLLALLKCVEIIGEAAAHVDEATRARYPGLPWSDMIGMRNRLVHMYFDIDLELLWTTVVADLPALVPELERIAGESTRD